MYIGIAFPIAVELYASLIFEKIGTICAAIGIFAACLWVCFFVDDTHTKERKMGIMFSCMALLSTIAVGVQAKGFSVHLLPTISFLLPALLLCLWILLVAPKIEKKENAALITSIALLGLLLAGSLLSNRYEKLHKETFTTSPLSQFIKENAAPSSSIFIESWSTNMIISAALYQNIQIASRFSSSWFNPALILAEQKKSKNVSNYKSILGGYILKDLESYKPKTLLLFREEDNKAALLRVFDATHLDKYINEYYQKSGEQSFLIGKDLFLEKEEIVFNVYKRRGVR